MPHENGRIGGSSFDRRCRQRLQLGRRQGVMGWVAVYQQRDIRPRDQPMDSFGKAVCVWKSHGAFAAVGPRQGLGVIL